MLKKALIGAALAIAVSNVAIAADGQAIVEKACQTCHAAGLLNSPKIGDAAAWETRNAKGMDALLASVKDGFNSMPAGGMCPDCSDDEYKAAIEFMSK
jgi:cytochrome c5